MKRQGFWVNAVDVGNSLHKALQDLVRPYAFERADISRNPLLSIGWHKNNDLDKLHSCGSIGASHQA
jgi:hypothetical protein